MRIKTYQLLNIAGLILTIVVNFLANALPIGGNSTGELSDLYPSLFTPAGITFSIWGLIYLLLIIFVTWQAQGILKKPGTVHLKFLYRIDLWFFVSCLANVAWIFSWHYEIVWLSVIIMLILLLALLVIYLRLGIGHRIISQGERYCVHLPFSVYLGWITVATIANISAFLVKIGWDGFGMSPVFWTSLMILMASLVAILVLTFRKDYYFGLVIIWALAGILFKRLLTDPSQRLAIWLTAGSGILLIFLLMVYLVMKKFLRKPDAG